jgi:hypothetical protein
LTFCLSEQLRDARGDDLRIVPRAQDHGAFLAARLACLFDPHSESQIDC